MNSGYKSGKGFFHIKYEADGSAATSNVVGLNISQSLGFLHFNLEKITFWYTLGRDSGMAFLVEREEADERDTRIEVAVHKSGSILQLSDLDLVEGHFRYIFGRNSGNTNNLEILVG